MEADKLRSWMRDAGLDVWAMIDVAISLAAADHAAPDIRARRDAILRRLYSAGTSVDEPRRKRGSAAAAAVGPISPPPPPTIQKVEKVESRPPRKEDQKQQMKPLDYQVRLASARKRLRENHLEAERAKKSRVNKVIEIHQIPIKPRKCGSAAVEPISPPPPLPATQKVEKVENRPPPKEEQKQQIKPLDDPVRLALARERLRENYLEVERAKKNRAPKVIGIHQIPMKPNVSVVRKTSFRGKRY